MIGIPIFYAVGSNVAVGDTLNKQLWNVFHKIKIYHIYIWLSMTKVFVFCPDSDRTE